MKIVQASCMENDVENDDLLGGLDRWVWQWQGKTRSGTAP
jgi:hypothetical protein